MNTSDQNIQPSHDEVAACAYYLWESEGRQEGREADYWFQAQAQLTGQTGQKPKPASTPSRNVSENATNARPAARLPQTEDTSPKKRRQENPAGRQSAAYA